MRGPLLLLRCRIAMALHRFWPLRPVTALFGAGFLVLGAGFLAADFLFFRRIFENLLATEEVPAALLTALAAKLMGLVLLTTFTLLLFSASVSALSFLYLDEDLSLLLPLPAGRGGLRGYRALEAGASASYMVALLLVPVAAAYWSLQSRNPSVLALDLLGLLLYLATPLAWGISFTVLMARFFPARRLHQVLTVLTVVMLCLLVVLFRLARPEALLNPATSLQVADVLGSIAMPSERLLPSTWLASLIVHGAEGRWDRALPGLVRLASLASASLVFLAVLLRLLHARGYGRAQEQGGLRPGTPPSRVARALVGTAVSLAPAGRASRAVLRRDLLLFFRDPTQWGQLIILAALVVIYLFNVRLLPQEVAVLKVAVSYWNLATLGLIVASVAGRFAFTAVSSEGKAYFASRALPLGVGSYLWAKYLFTAVPLSMLASCALYGSNRFLGVRGEALHYTLFLAMASSLALAALALCLGCVAPVFDARNPAKAVMSAWGLTYMFLSLLYVGLVLVLSARPVYRYYAHLVGRGPEADFAGAALQVGAVSFALVVLCMGAAASRLKGLEPA
ncbi:MAG: putative ABC transporter permease subunit [Acidobacteriota bacterium]